MTARKQLIEPADFGETARVSSPAITWIHPPADPRCGIAKKTTVMRLYTELFNTINTNTGRPGIASCYSSLSLLLADPLLPAFPSRLITRANETRYAG